MLGIAVLFFAGLWLIAIIFSLILGWKIARRMTRSAGKPIGIWIGFIGMALGFYVSVGFYIHKEWLLYRKEKALVEAFCAENPRIEVFITPEELAKINIDNIYVYKKYQYEFSEKKPELPSKRIMFRDTEYVKSTLELDSGLDNFSYSLYTGQSILSKDIYTDPDKQLILFQISDAKAIGFFNPNILGKKSWFKNIRDCELTEENHNIRSKLFSQFRPLMENRRD